MTAGPRDSATGSGGNSGLQDVGAAAKSPGPNLAGILDTIDVPIIVVGHDCKMTFFNQAATETLGVTSSDLGRQTCDMPSLAGMRGIDQSCLEVMAGGAPSRRDVRNGDRSFLLHIAPYTAANGQICGAVLTFTNVTAFRASVAQAIYEREYTKTILNAVIDPLVVLDKDLQIQTGNRAFFDWFGVSRDQIRGVLLSNLGDQHWKSAGFWASLKATLHEKRDFQPLEFERDFPGGGRRTFLLDARRLGSEGNPLVLLALRDITARKQAEQAMHESETRFRTLFESMDEGYCVVEVIFDEANYPLDYQFLEVNPVFEKQTGIKDAKGKFMRQIAPDHEQPWFDIYGHIALTGETRRFEMPAAALHRYYDVCAFRVGPAELRRVGVIFNDITQRKNLEQQREKLLAHEETLRKDAEAASRAKDRFLAALSHELRTPLSPVVMTVAVWENDPNLPPEFREDMAMIRRNIELETRLIDDLLDLNRVTTGKMRLQMQPTHIHAAIKQAMQNCESDTLAKKLNVEVNLDADNDLVHADPARLQQVFWNLLRNAAKFTSENGNIYIRTESIGGKVHVEVRDTGVGIAAEFLPRIFDAFEQGDIKTTRQFGGLGLGLAICKAIMDMHGGVIRAHSDGPGTGATFTVEFFATLDTDREALAAQDLLPRRGPTDQLRVLLVDDHRDTREVLGRLLSASNYAVKTASSVESALQLAGAEPFDIVISDLGLPDGSGYELMQQIRDRHGIKGIALSGYGMEEDHRRSRASGFLDHLVKPVNISHLLATIQRVVGGDMSGEQTPAVRPAQ